MQLTALAEYREPIRRQVSEQVFKFIHSSSLIYNACWEDPRLDREALRFTENDRVVMLTSAGCNALDYLLAGAGDITCVDLNPKQNALLELKLAAILELDWETFFQLFGKGHLEGARDVYSTRLRKHLSWTARQIWDRGIDRLDPRNFPHSLYMQGSSGLFARGVNLYIDKVANVRYSLECLLDADSLAEQREIYFEDIKPFLWSRMLRWFINRDTVLALLGVPGAQKDVIDQSYGGGLERLVEDALDAVFGRLSIKDNYFYRVYLTGGYTTHCCPEYLKQENFRTLRELVPGRIRVHTGSLVNYLEESSEPFNKIVLLDHMDWLRANSQRGLVAEWEAIAKVAAPDAKIIWRSGGRNGEFVNTLPVVRHGVSGIAGDFLSYERELAAKLHRLDRVHTYGSFCIATMH